MRIIYVDMGIGLIIQAIDQASTPIPPRVHDVLGKTGSRFTDMVWLWLREGGVTTPFV